MNERFKWKILYHIINYLKLLSWIGNAFLNRTQYPEALKEKIDKTAV